jgi:putative transposase
MELESGLKKDGQMKRARFTEEQIIAVLKEHEAGTKTADLARKHGISEATIYHWKARFGGMDVSEAKRLKALEEENAKLKKLLAEQMLDAAALRELLAKKWEGPPPNAPRWRIWRPRWACRSGGPVRSWARIGR